MLGGRVHLGGDVVDLEQLVELKGRTFLLGGVVLGHEAVLHQVLLALAQLLDAVGAHVVRVHDVAATVQALTVYCAVLGAR